MEFKTVSVKSKFIRFPIMLLGVTTPVTRFLLRAVAGVPSPLLG